MTAFEALTNPPASTRPYDESLMTAAVAVVGGKQAASGIRSAAHTFAQLTTGSLLNTHTQSHLQPSSLITPRCFASKAGRRCTATCSHSHTQSQSLSQSTCHSAAALLMSAFPPWAVAAKQKPTKDRVGECLFVRLRLFVSPPDGEFGSLWLCLLFTEVRGVLFPASGHFTAAS